MNAKTKSIEIEESITGEYVVDNGPSWTNSIIQDAVITTIDERNSPHVAKNTISQILVHIEGKPTLTPLGTFDSYELNFTLDELVGLTFMQGREFVRNKISYYFNNGDEEVVRVKTGERIGRMISGTVYRRGKVPGMIVKDFPVGEERQYMINLYGGRVVARDMSEEDVAALLGE